MTDLEKFEHLIKTGHRCISMTTFEEREALDLIGQAAMALGFQLTTWSIVGGLRDSTFIDGPADKSTEHPVAALFTLANRDQPTFCVMLDLAGHLKDARTLRLLRDVLARFERTDSHLVLVDHADVLPPVVNAFATTFELSLPGDEELERLVRQILRRLHGERPLRVDISQAGFDVVIKNLKGLNRRQVRQIVAECVAEDRVFDARDINTVLARKRQMIRAGGLLDYVESPVSMDEIAGMKRLKQWLALRRQVMAGKPELFGVTPPRGILLLGVQGAGKSYCAKAIATAWQRPLLRMDVGALYDRYIGESEKRLREALRQAEITSPIILWIDEIEKAFASAASRSTDGGLSQRMFGSLLTWMQERAGDVFLVATANDIEALPPELLRKGRFDEIFFVDLPDAEMRAEIFAVHLARRKRDPRQFDLQMLAGASDGYSGAEIEQATLAAAYDAAASGEPLNTLCILDALRASPPLSVTMAEKVRALRAWAEGRCVPAN